MTNKTEIKTKELPKKEIGLQRVFAYYFGRIKTRKRSFLGVFFLRLVTTVTPLVGPYYLGQFIDTITNFQGGDKTSIMSVLFSFVFIILGIELLQRLCRRLFDVVIIRPWVEIMGDIHKACYDYVQYHSYKYFSDTFSGALVKKIGKMVNAFDVFLEITIFDFFGLFIQIGVIVVIVCFQNLTLGLVFFAWLVVYSTLQYFLYKRKLKYEIAHQKQESKVTGVLSDIISNNFTISIFASYRQESKLFAKEVKSVVEKNIISRRMGALFINSLNDLLMVGLLIGILYYIVVLRGDGLMTVGTITLLRLYLFRVFDKMFMLRNVFGRFNKITSDSIEMLEILDTPHEIQDIPKAKTLTPNNGQIDFEGVDFGYNNDMVFKDFNLSIKPGEKVALVGQSGSGKTTIVRLLFRFFDIQGGAIKIDGQDIAKVTQESLRSHISMVPQDPILFHRSLAENIAYGKPDATREEIIQASKKAHCHEFITKLEDGYDTMVGERGIKLSGGQRQRVAIARAILENKKIFVMDEATSSLDSESEKLIQDALKYVFENKTVIVVAHRLSTVMEMDRIIVLGAGQNGSKILEQGSHNQLLEKEDGQYKKLRDIQSGGFLE